jgi:hypothetical protein
LLERALAFVAERGDPAEVMINHVLEIDESGDCMLYELPTGDQQP